MQILERLATRIEALEKRNAEKERSPDIAGGTTRPDPSSESASAVSHATRFEATLHKEVADPTWEREFQATATKALASENIKGVSVENIACGSSLCRLDVAVPSDAPPLSLTRAISEQAPHGGIWSTTDEAVVPPGKAVFYVARAGALLPGLFEPDGQ